MSQEYISFELYVSTENETFTTSEEIVERLQTFVVFNRRENVMKQAIVDGWLVDYSIELTSPNTFKIRRNSKTIHSNSQLEEILQHFPDDEIYDQLGWRLSNKGQFIMV